jgi:hypothetical protein
MSKITSISKLKVIYGYQSFVLRNRSYFVIGDLLKLSFWHRISNSTLSGRRDGVAGEAEAKAASLMAPRPPEAQELTQFNRKPL